MKSKELPDFETRRSHLDSALCTVQDTNAARARIVQGCRVLLAEGMLHFPTRPRKSISLAMAADTKIWGEVTRFLRHSTVHSNLFASTSRDLYEQMCGTSNVEYAVVVSYINSTFHATPQT